MNSDDHPTTVIIDSNVLFGSWQLEGDRWDSLSSLCEGGAFKVALPRLVIAETAGNYKREVTKIQSAASKVGLPTPEVELDGYEDRLSSRAKQLGFEIIGGYAIGVDELIQMAINRVPPFNENGDGFRDTLIWHCALDACDEGRTALVSNDKDFRNGDKLKPALVEQARSRGDLVWYPNLASFFEGEGMPKPGDAATEESRMQAAEEAELQQEAELLQRRVDALGSHLALSDIVKANTAFTQSSALSDIFKANTAITDAFAQSSALSDIFKAVSATNDLGPRFLEEDQDPKASGEALDDQEE